MKDKKGNNLSSGEFGEKVLIRIRTILLELEVSLLHLVGHCRLHHVRLFFYGMAGIKIGKGSAIHTGARFYNPVNIRIGRDTIVGEGCVMDGRDVLRIGDHVDIASDVMIYNSEHDVDDENFQAVCKPVEIGDYVFVGPRAIILPGVSVGKGAVVAAGAVVTKNVEPFSIVAGVPAKEIGKRKNQDPHYKLGRAAWFR